jgi:hypothetical protein
MPSEFICRIEMDLAIPDFMDASVPLEQIANKVADDSQKNIRQQTNLDGSAYEGLSKKTIQDKIRQGSANPRMALYRKGVMYRAIHVYQLSKNDFEVGIIPRGSPRRDMVGMIHQEIGPVIRTFLGFTTQTYKWANARIERWLNERTQKAARKLINLKY